MINQVFQLVSPRTFSVKYDDIDINDSSKVIVRPRYISLCHADQRYYQGLRSPEILAKKLPSALIHEACGEIVADPSGTYAVGQKVVMIPNQPSELGNEEFYENYKQGGYFRSSGHDGFMRELVELPVDRVVAYDNVPGKLAAATEFISVSMHAMERFKKNAHSVQARFVVWGDGSLAYVTAIALRYEFPKAHITVVGKGEAKLSLFTFVDQTLYASDIPADFTFDHAFECCGGEGSYYAIDDIIKYIQPQGTLILMGVTENRVAINTRDILEKGLLLVGSSRSGRPEFQSAVKMLEDKAVQNRLLKIIGFQGAARNVDDIHEMFRRDLTTPFKTVFKWEV
jgi:ribitol-5-phosphate 2-dehydrogenase